MKQLKPQTGVNLTDITYGGQAIGTLESGKKIFVWGGLPDEIVDVALTKNKSSHAEGIVTNIVRVSSNRVDPKDPDSYLSTSPWQIMDFETEQQYKAKLIQDAFGLHHIDIESPQMISDDRQYGYRNKMEYSFWWDEKTDQVNLALFRRGSHQKIAIRPSSLASSAINQAAENLIKLINDKNIDSRQLKTALIRSTKTGDVVMQLYVKDENFGLFGESEFKGLSIKGLEIIFSNPKSPASVITKKLAAYGDSILTDDILGINFQYVAEGFFQVNLGVYELALKEMNAYIDRKLPTLDMYSGVGTIGLTIGSKDLTMVETNEPAVNEMRRNISRLERYEARAILSDSEKALGEIKPGINLILDPPRAGCHDDLIEKIMEIKPKNIIYLSCNPVTQARDIAKLTAHYQIVRLKGFNFFPRTPHIENLAVLKLK